MPSYDKTPQPIADLHNDLWTQVVLLHGRLLAFRALFATDDATVALLNRTAGSFFEMVSRLLIETLILQICRLTDPPGSGQRTNLTLTRLEAAIDPRAYTKLAKKIATLLKTVESQSKPLRIYRDKHLAHTDLQVHRREAKVDRVTYGEIEAVIGSFREILDAIELEFEERQTAYELFTQTADAKHLVYYLERAEQCQERERKARGW